jgi:hypothetical protein
MRVYKVVFEHDDKLYSAIVNNFEEGYDFGVFQREYKEGETTYPPVPHPNALLMAFSTFHDAVTFARNEYNRDNLVVFEAEATRVEVNDVSLDLGGYRSLARFWKRGGYSYSGPPGTVLCTDITLIKRVWSIEEGSLLC